MGQTCYDGRMPTVEPLVQKLIENQEREQLGTRAFARKLGVAPSVWSRVRRGENRPARAFVEAALRTYPELAYVYTAALHRSAIEAA